MSSTLIRPGGRLRRTFAGVLASALVAAPLALIPGSAQADPDAPTLTWKISDWFGEHLGTQTYANGASGASNVITFPDGVGTKDPATGVTSVTYAGSVRGSFVAGIEQYSITVASPTVAVDAAGKGTISADVSWTVGAASAGGPARVVMTTFDASISDWATSGGLSTLTKTPHWEGVLPAGSEAAVAAGITNTARPVDGKAFSPELIGALNPGLKAHFYASTSQNDPKKTPSAFTAVAPVPVATVASATITKQTPSSLEVAVSGTGYKPGSPGIYVSIGETGNDDVINAGEYLGTVWTNNPGNPDSAVKQDGTFSTTLTLDAAAIAQLDPTKSYSVITFKAHGQAATDPSQTATRPLAIDFAAFAKYTSAPAITTANKVYGKSAAVVVTVPTVNGVVATGNVVLAGAGTQTKALSGGKATFTLPANLSPGARNLTASFQGDGNYVAATSATKKLTVTKDAVTITDKVTKKPTTKKAGKIRITVKAKSSSIKPTGKVKVYFKKKGQKTVVTSTSSLKNGVKTLSVKKLKKKGTWKIYVKYTAGTGYNSVSSKYVGTVKVTK